ncbi:MAG: PepSY-associated TM helix domain-containing protein, partial [Planctomycetota bacterium]
MNGVSIRKRSTLYRKSAATIRWLHIYLSMLGFTALMFFSLTGITLNHPTWFGASEQRIVDEDGQLPVDWMEEDSAAGINQLMIAEHLRQEHSLRGRVTEFETSEFDVMVVFKSPGYAADVFINRDDGRYTVTTI